MRDVKRRFVMIRSKELLRIDRDERGPEENVFELSFSFQSKSFVFLLDKTRFRVTGAP
jgi:hypothetical protein